jgi:hypothetical protein
VGRVSGVADSRVVLDRVVLIADDLGRLRRRLPPDTPYAGWLVERLGKHVETLDAMLRPTAADRYRAYVLSGLVEDEAVQAALDTVDAEADELRRRLGIDRDPCTYPTCGAISAPTKPTPKGGRR